MITNFDSLYAGHVDMTNIGYGGTAVNDRLFDNDHLATVFRSPRLSPKRWTRTATTLCGWPSTISSPRGTSASPTC